MKPLYLLAILSILLGCDNDAPAPTYHSTPYPVVIVAVTYDEETGVGDWTTVVEFPDGDRRRRGGRYGEVGDTFVACKYDHPYTDGRWVSVPLELTPTERTPDER